MIYQIICDMSINELENITGYYIFKNKPVFDVDKELSTNDLIDVLEDRLLHVYITHKQKELLKTMAETAETWD